jgi:phosphoglucomutase
MSDALKQIDDAVSAGKLTPSARENLQKWLHEERYATYRGTVVSLVEAGKWRELDDAFWTVIPFGTGGRRGRMYPVGSNAINDRTIGESAQGLADYINDVLPAGQPRGCAIAYDTRHNSRHFAELCAGIMAAAGFTVYFLDDYRATPQLSFAVRQMKCSCGIMVTASHNPPSDNAVKVYWSTGGQVLPPHDKEIIQRVMTVDQVKAIPFADAIKQGNVKICTQEVDRAYIEAAVPNGFSGPRSLRLLYTPLHGVGAAAVLPLLQRDGFGVVEVFAPHREPSGDFPNVPGHVSNPENAKVFDAPIDEAQRRGFELILATDPDCDRLGVATPLTTDTAGPWTTLNGNQIAALLADYVLQKRQQLGTLKAKQYVVKTLVTTDMITRIATSYGVRCIGDLLVGFKWIGGVIDREGPDDFIFGAEESHGYLVGKYARDKDGAIACMLLAELAAQLKQQGRTVAQHLETLYRQHGYFAEHLINVQMEGSEGMGRMARLMQQLRTSPPKELAGLKVMQVRDYEHQQVIGSDGTRGPLQGPKGDMIFLDLDAGNQVAVRPSGTEPKVKFYLFTNLSAAQSQQLEQARKQLADRIAQVSAACRSYVDSIK